MRITLTVPPECLETAKRASQALDADVGGYFAFELQDEQGNYTYSVELPEGYPEQIQYLMSSPEILQGFISQQFFARFPEAVTPSLTECEHLVNSITIS